MDGKYRIVLIVQYLQGATNELFAQLSGNPPKDYLPEISRLTQEENEELQHICGKAAPRLVCIFIPIINNLSRPVINYGVNMTTSQFVVGIGHLMGYPMDFGFGPECSYAFICFCFPSNLISQGRNNFSATRYYG